MNPSLVPAQDSCVPARGNDPPSTPSPWLTPHPRYDDLSSSQAVAAFQVSMSTLRRLLASDALGAHRISGLRGREWRISAAALEQAGYVRRAVSAGSGHANCQADRSRLVAALAAERAHSAELDGELGYALLTVGRLRGRLREAGINPDELFGGDLGRQPSVDQS